MIRISGLHKVYSQRGREIVALDGVDLHVRRGEVMGVVGPSGAGKSTLIRCVNLLERPTAGEIVVDGTDLTSLDGPQLLAARRRIGMIFQHFNLLDSRTVAGNISYPLELAGVPRRERREKVAELIELVGLEARADAHPAQLSGGQKQRVGIARALAADPHVLLCDEATSALDPETTRSILALLRDLNERLGLTIMLITHEMQVVKQICDSAALLRDGRVVESGGLGELVSSPASELAAELLPQTAPAATARGLASASAHTDGLRVVDVTLVGAAAGQPILAALVRRFDVDVNVLAGSIEDIGGHRVGRLRLGLPGSRAESDDVVEFLAAEGFRPEEVA
jgi:D-methionine transport system ATP-binding protein